MDLRGITLPGIRALADMLPSRLLVGQSGPYLQRYVLGKMAGGEDIYLHHFLAPDDDPSFHCHPWNGTGFLLHGGYLEERLPHGLVLNGVSNTSLAGHLRNQVVETWCRKGDVNPVTPHTFHRIKEVEPDTWTLFVTGRKLCSWTFLDVDTGEQTPWRDRLRSRGLTVDE